MKLIYLLIILLGFFSSGSSQGITNNWILGYGPVQRTLFDFDSASLSINQITFPMEYRGANTTISDLNGNFIFSTNGVYISDATGDTMQNGSGLNPGFYATMYPDGLSISQADLVIPKPGSDSTYFLFHSTLDNQATTQCQFLYLTIIEMSGNGGLGVVTTKNLILINDFLNLGKITACKHANGRDWWVFCHKGNSNIFYYFLITL